MDTAALQQASLSALFADATALLREPAPDAQLGAMVSEALGIAAILSRPILA